MHNKVESVRVEQRWGNRPALQLRLAVALGLLLGAGSPVWAQVVSATDEFGARVHLAEQLLQSEKPSEALGVLEEAFAMRQEPRVLYLQGLAQQKMANSQGALLLWQRFLVAANVAGCCVEERRAASQHVLELRRLVEAGAPAGEPAALGIPPISGESDAGSADQTPGALEYAAHVERARRLLQSEQPSDALRELDAAFALRQEPHVVYLQALALQKLGQDQSAFVRFQRFLVAIPGDCCADERSYASRRIATLRPRFGPGVLVSWTPGMRLPIAPVQKTSRGRTAAIVVSSIIGGVANLALIAYGISKIDLGPCCGGFAFSSGR